MTKVPNRQVSLDSRRIHLEREIAIRVPQFDSFVTEYSGNISTTGMFILTDKPLGHGTELNFEFSVADDWKLIRGKAQVVWTRYGDEGPERPPGMGVRFIHLDAQSRRLIRWIVEKHIREGGKPFELEELRTVIDDALDQVLDEPTDAINEAPVQPSTPSAKTRGALVTDTAERSSSKQPLPLILTAAGVVALVAALFWLTEWLPKRSRASDETAAQTQSGVTEENGTPDGATAESSAVDPEAAGSVDTATAEPATAAGEPDASPSPATDGSPTVSETAATEATGGAPIGSAYRAVRTLVESWAEAWSSRDPDRYLSFYSQDFRSESGQSRSAWAATRRERLAAPKFIKVSVSGLEMERLDNDTVRARFFQNYRSDRFTDSIRKTLDLVWEQGTWKIAREFS